MGEAAGREVYSKKLEGRGRREPVVVFVLFLVLVMPGRDADF